MSRFQLVAVAIALALVILDGFDVAVMSYAAPAVARAWTIDPVMLGILLSGSLFGMAAGSILLTPLADRIGRRKLTLLSLTIASIGMMLTLVSVGTTGLLVARVITGLGVGGMMANLIVLVSEYASDKRRGSIIGIYAAGYPIGATIGGLIAGPLIPAFGWRAIFAVGAAMTLALLALAWTSLPESLDYLITRRPAGALAKVNAILVRMGRPALEDLPVAQQAEQRTGAVREILTGPIRFRTFMLWIGYACLVGAYYFVNTWTPKIIAEGSGRDSLGVTVGVIANAGGILGCFLFGALAIRFLPRALLIVSLALSAAAYILFGVVFHIVPVALVIALVLGVLTTSAIAGFYAMTPGIYSARARATGMGWMIGIGRLMSIVAPIMVGFLLDGGWQPENIYFVFAIPLAVAALCIAAVGVSLKRTARTGTATLIVSPQL